ncbi:mitochondrial fission ELM1 family protein [Acidisphaera sp. L21]|uniref:mitochondrial fission ELM1 family protein n=1 Tax=Acidisphaera sp. L21 TaxID=1641851 RepID=UPI00131EC902|nr:mitochondrial fission ELM1 family protein [Acidisphaera sp. L21]
MRSQVLGLAEAAGLHPRMLPLQPRLPWWWMPGKFWPSPLRAVRLKTPPEPLAIGCGGKAAPVLKALRRRGKLTVQIQHPRMDIRHFDQVVVNRHDELTGPNVIVTRTALHRATPERLEAARLQWTDRLAHLPRPLVAVLVGGSNGRFRLEAGEGAALAKTLATMMTADHVGLILTPSRRTGPLVQQALRDALIPLGAQVWDGQGENPYFGMLACADAIIVTADSVSMVSEAVATSVPVLLAELPGRSRRIGAFTDGLRQDGRVRTFAGRLELWPTSPLDDTQAAADILRQRLGF